jgi:hypothetical protein
MPSPKKKPIRWSIQQASIEFGTSPPTLGKALAQASIAPAADGTYTTRQICEGLFGSMHLEKIRTQRELARKLELENAITTARVLNRAELEKVFSQLADALQQVVRNSDLDWRSQDDFLHNLATWPILLEDTAAAQSRLVNGKDSEAEV